MLWFLGYALTYQVALGICRPTTNAVVGKAGTGHAREPGKPPPLACALAPYTDSDSENEWTLRTTSASIPRTSIRISF